MPLARGDRRDRRQAELTRASPEPPSPDRPRPLSRSRSPSPPADPGRCRVPGSVTARASPELALFVGRFHPTLRTARDVAAPGARSGSDPPAETGAPPSQLPASSSIPSSWLAALSGFATAFAGWLLSHEGLRRGAPDRHLWSGVATGIGAFAACMLRSLAKAQPGARGPQAPGHRPRGGHVRNDDLRRSRGEPDPRRGTSRSMRRRPSVVWLGFPSLATALRRSSRP
jgi:hypothetical protein